MIKNIVIYLIILAAVFVFSIFYYAWFSWVLLLITICVPFLSLLISLPFMIIGAYQGFSVFTEKEVYKGQKIGIGVTRKRGESYFCPFAKIKFKVNNKFAKKKDKLTFKLCGSFDKPAFIKSKKLALNCGCIEISAKYAKIYDFTGIFFIPVRINCFAEIFVMPKAEKPYTLPDSDMLTVLGYKAKAGGGFSDIYELRQYQSGDSLKNIHWKLSSKTDELIVREPNVPVYRQFVVKAALCNDAEKNDSILSRLIYTCRYLDKIGIGFFADSGLGYISQINGEYQLNEYVKALYRGIAYNKCEIYHKSSVVYSILPESEEVIRV